LIENIILILLASLFFIFFVNIFLRLKKHKEVNHLKKKHRLSSKVVEAMASKIKFDSMHHRKKR